MYYVMYTPVGLNWLSIRNAIKRWHLNKWPWRNRRSVIMTFLKTLLLFLLFVKYFRWIDYQFILILLYSAVKMSYSYFGYLYIFGIMYIDEELSICGALDVKLCGFLVPYTNIIYYVKRLKSILKNLHINKYIFHNNSKVFLSQNFM